MRRPFLGLYGITISRADRRRPAAVHVCIFCLQKWSKQNSVLRLNEDTM
jgi:hypothetical protein